MNNENLAQAFEYTKELRNALRAEILAHERGGKKPSMYETLKALDLIVDEGEGRIAKDIDLDAEKDKLAELIEERSTILRTYQGVRPSWVCTNLAVLDEKIMRQRLRIAMASQ